MNNPFRSLVVVVAALLVAASGCSQNTSTAAKPAAAAAAPASTDLSPDTVVATYNDKKVTLAEVDKLIAPQLKDLEKKKFEARENAANSFVIQALVTEKAKAAGKTEDQWVQEQAEAKVQPPSDEELQKVFDSVKARMPPDATFEKVKPQLVQFVTNQKKQDAAQQLFDELMKEAHAQILLQEPRVEVEAKGPSRGPDGAKVTIVEFSDFQCPFCSRAEESVEKVMSTFAGKVKLYYRNFPLPFHEHAEKAAEAAACANAQGKFWEYHDVLFKNQQKLTVPDLKQHAVALGLDAKKFDECLDSGEMKSVIEADKAAGSKVGVNGTPAFFINGIMLSGAQPFSKFEQVINQELAKAN